MSRLQPRCRADGRVRESLLSLEDPLLDDLRRAVEADEPVSEELLHALSGLEEETLVRFRQAWAQMNTEDRAELIAHLSEAAEKNLALDYAAVCQIAVEDPDPAVRFHAFLLASIDGSPQLFEPSLRAAANDPDDEARMAAVEALGVFALQAQAEGWPEETQNRIQQVLLAQLHNSHADDDLRQAALLSLAYLTTAESEREIRQAYGDPSLRLTAIEAMGRNCQDIWFPDLIAELRSANEDFRLTAVLAAMETEDETLVPMVLERVRDPIQDVRLAAIQALGVIGGEEAEAALITLQHASDPRERAAAREALAEAQGRDDLVVFEDEPGPSLN